MKTTFIVMLGMILGTPAVFGAQTVDYRGSGLVIGGGKHCLTIRRDGSLWAWGHNYYGQVGNGSGSDTINYPVQVSISSDVAFAAAGGQHSLAIKTNGTLWAWGNNGSKRLGVGSIAGSINTPTQVSTLLDVQWAAGGEAHSLAVRTNGSVWVWGDNSYRQLGYGTADQSLPFELTAVTSALRVAAGSYHSLALDQSGRVWAWGRNTYGQSGNGSIGGNQNTPITVSNLTNIVAIAAGLHHSAALRNDGTIWTWGYNQYGQLGDGTTTDTGVPVQVVGMSAAIYVECGEHHTIAVTADGYVWAWGYNANGQLGLASAGNRTVPEKVVGLVRDTVNNVADQSGVLFVSAGDASSVALKSDGTVWTWGLNDVGQLGTSNTISQSLPVLLPFNADPNFNPTFFVVPTADMRVNGMVAAGSSFSMALDQSGRVWSWGSNEYGKLGSNSPSGSLEPKVVTNGFLHISAMNHHALALATNSTVYAWGNNDDGRLGDGTTATRTVPTSVAGLTNVVAVSAGRSHSLALKKDGTVWAWGNNDYGQVGNGTTAASLVPVPVNGLSGIVAIAAGGLHSLALSANGAVWAWGYNGNQQLGDSTTLDRRIPVRVQTLEIVRAIAGGEKHSMALTANGIVLCWGKNASGQIGDGSAVDPRPKPTRPSGVEDVMSIGVGWDASYVVKTNGLVWAWGSDADGQLGIIGTSANLLPQAMLAVTRDVANLNVANQGGVLMVVGGNNHCLVVKLDGTVWVCGSNGSGELGDNTTVRQDVIKRLEGFNLRTSPPANTFAISGISYQRLAAGSTHSLAVKSNGTVMAWGNNPDGRLGNGTVVDSLVPVNVNTISAARELAAGDTHSLAAIDNGVGNGAVYAWGGNANGQLGVGDYVNKSAPTLIPGLTLSSNSHLSAGGLHSMVISNGQLYTWGNNSYGQLGIAASTGNTNAPQRISGASDIAEISGGFRHSLVVRSNGTVWSCGNNSYGQIGDGSTTERNTFVEVNGLRGVKAVAGGKYHSLALKTNGTVWAWGQNASGELGQGVKGGTRVLPVEVVDIKNVVRIAAGDSYSIAETSDGVVWTWGKNNLSQLGDGSVTNHNRPVEVAGLWRASLTALGRTVVGMAGGGNHSVLLLKDGSFWSWGANTSGQLGTGTTIEQSTAVMVDGFGEYQGALYVGKAAKSPLTAGEHHSVVVRSDGTAWAWGRNQLGQLGLGTNATEMASPSRIPGISNAVSVAAGSDHSLAIRRDGTLWTWGDNSSHQLGINSTMGSTNAPAQVSIGAVKTAAGGHLHSLAVGPGGAVYSWGNNANQQLGDNTTTTRQAPVSVIGLGSGIAEVACGGYHSVALGSNGLVWVWGDNAYGQVGAGTTGGNQGTPLQVPTLDGVISIAAGTYHSLALRTNGTVWAWGYNSNGELGFGHRVNTNRPSLVNGLRGVVAISTAGRASFALRADGTMWAWGDNAFSQLGDGYKLDRLLPVPIEYSGSILSIEGGGNGIGGTPAHSLALLKNGDILSWGNNDYGQLGNGSTVNTNRSIGDTVSGLRVLKQLIGGYSDPLAGGRINRYSTNQEARDGLFQLGATQSSMTAVETMDWQKGIALANDFIRHFPPAVTNNLSARWTVAQHYNETNESSPLAFSAPLAAFGSVVNSSKLLTGQSYSWRVHFGVLGGAFESELRVVCYYRSNGLAFATNTIVIPAETNSVSYPNFVQQGITNTANGLVTIVRPDDYGLNRVLPSYSYTPLQITHQGSNAEYFYEVQGSAVVQTPKYYDPFLSTAMDTAETNHSRLYVLNFDLSPSWYTAISEVPNVKGQPLPPAYLGKSRLELEAVRPPWPTLPPLTNDTQRLIYLQVNQSPELRVHPELTNFVNDLRADPLALANYVINEVENSDVADPRDDISDGLVRVTGINRGAWAVFQEGQGSPMEQCGLLVCLLRLAGMPAIYVFPTNNGVTMLAHRVDDMIGYPLFAPAPKYESQVNVRFPWVAAWTGDRWVHIFPWIKDIKLVQGLSLYEYMPKEYDNGYKWMVRFMESDTNITWLDAESDQPLVLWPKFIENALLAHPGISIDDLGIKSIKRQRQHDSWDSLPRPFAISGGVSILDSYARIPRIFNQAEIDVNGTSGRFLMSDLHNRAITVVRVDTYIDELRFAAVHAGMGAPRTLPLNDPFDLGAWATFKAQLGVYPSLPFKVTYDRVRPVEVLGPPEQWAAYNGLPRESDVKTHTYNAGGAYGFSINFGRVTKKMVDVHAHEIWRHRDEVENGGTADKAIYRGLTMFLMGQTYWENVGRFGDLNYRMHGIRPLRTLGHLTAMLQPGSSGKYEPRIDVPYVFNHYLYSTDTNMMVVSSNSITVSSYAMMGIAQASAAEHGVVGSFLQDTNAVSTYKLLQKLNPSQIVRISPDNYRELGERQFGSKKLREYDPTMWQAVITAMEESDAVVNQAHAFLTPGDQTNGTFKGMGGLILTKSSSAALISGMINGGIAMQLPTANFASITAFTLNPGLRYGYSITFDDYDSQAIGFTPIQLGYHNVGSTLAAIGGQDLLLDNYFLEGLSPRLRATYSFGSEPLAATTTMLDRGVLGGPSFLSDPLGWVADPVNVVSGNFYVDQVDLVLPGPMPLEIRRTYSSHNESANLFGFGWNFGYMPFLTLNTNKNIYFAAEMDGSVIAYSPVSATNWAPSIEFNPQLNNRNHGKPGSVGNLMNSRLEMTAINGVTNFYLYGPDGSVRRYLVQKYPIRGTNSSQILDRSRPYLQEWLDHRGNGYEITFGTDTNRSDYGQVRRIDSNNGNFVLFNYDAYSRVVEAFAGDGRRLRYEYDTQGDLVSVIRPDGSTFRFEYQHLSMLTNINQKSSVKVTNYYSTHLITRETKPDGRVLLNEYDEHRRVTNQWATVGPDLRLVHNATFYYSNSFRLSDLTNEFAVTNTLSGYTTTTDVNTNVTRYDYYKNLITSVTEATNSPALTRSNVTEWYMPGDTSVGAYPRSVKRMTDPRGLISEFKYDAKGNLTNAVVTGDLTGAGYLTNAVTTYQYDSNNLLTNTVEATGNRTAVYLDGTFRYLPRAVVSINGGTVVSSNYFEYYTVAAGTTNSNGLLRRKVSAAGSSDESTTEWVHDARGFIVQEIGFTGSGDPNVTNSFRYSGRGEIAEQVDGGGRTNRFDYDGMGRPRAKEVFDELGSTLSSEYTYYNDNGEVTWLDGPRFGPEDYVWKDYDGAGRLTEEVRWRSRAKPAGNGVEAYPGEELYSPSFNEYDAFGNHVRSTDALGHYSLMSYDVLGQLITRRAYDASGALLSTNGYAYEIGGAIAKEWSPLGGETRKFYTTTGKPRRQENSDGSSLEWRYLVDGRVQKEILQNGSSWETIYDDANRKITRIFRDFANTPLATNVQYLDRRGNSVTNVDAVGNVFFTLFDGLNRPKFTSGPGPVPQTTTNIYDASGKILRTRNALGEETYVVNDALGRVLTNEVRNSLGTVVRRSITSYAADHQSVTTINNQVVQTTWTDTADKPVLVQNFTSPTTFDYSINTYNFVGNLVASRDELGQTTSFTYDGLNRLKTTVMPDSAMVSLAYNAAGSITNRTMPGGLVWSAGYDVANRLLAQELTGGGISRRRTTNSYYTTGPVGLLKTVTDPRNNVSTISYDAFLRRTNTVVAGSLSATNRVGLDLLNRMTNSFELCGTNAPVEISREFNAYGNITREVSRIGGVVAQEFVQSWNGAGRRVAMSTPATWFNRSFSHRADGLISSINESDTSQSSYQYDLSGLLTGRSNGWWTSTIYRDARGRIELREASAVAAGLGGIYADANTWRSNSTRSSFVAGRPDLSDVDQHDFQYNNRNQLLSESYVPANGQVVSNLFAFDANKLGVRTSAATWKGSVSNSWSVPTAKLNGLGEIVQEETQVRHAKVYAQGKVADPATFALTLDGSSAGVSQLQIDGFGILKRWTAELAAAPGQHSVIASAYCPDSVNGIIKATNRFEVASGIVLTTNLYDAAGNLVYRRLGTFTEQTNIFDAYGRLTAVRQSDGTNGFNWSALYDGLGRRLRTYYTPFTSTSNAPAEVIDSGYDPLVEFLEVSVAVNGQRTWKCYGLDLTGSYGGAQGIGGLELTRRDSDGTKVAPLHDLMGHVVGNAVGLTVIWVPPNRYTAYGPAQGYEAPAFGSTLSVSESHIWQGRRLDPIGYYWMGARYYDSRSGRFISTDPLGHESSLDLYGFCQGDPINQLDADGRIATRAAESLGEWAGTKYGNAMAHYDSLLNPHTRSQALRDTMAGLSRAPTDWALETASGLNKASGLMRGDLFGYGVVTKINDLVLNGWRSFADSQIARFDSALGADPTSSSYASSRFLGESAINIGTLFLPIGEVNAGVRSGQFLGRAEGRLASTLEGAAAKTGEILRAPESWTKSYLSKGTDVLVPQGTSGIRNMMAKLTADSGNEVALLRLTDGTRVFRMGGPNFVKLGRDVETVIAHTHPSGSLNFSTADIIALWKRDQLSSVLINPQTGLGKRVSVSGNW